MSHELKRRVATGIRAGGALAVMACAAVAGMAHADPARAASALTPPGGLGFGSALLGSTPTGDGPSLMALDPATHTAYVVNGDNLNGPNQGGDTVSVIDTRGCNARAVWACRGPWPTVTVGNLPSGVAVDTATDTVYVSNAGDLVNPGTVSVFNGATCNAEDRRGCGQTPATVPVGVAPLGVDADGANHTVYVANPGDNTVSMIDSATCNGTHLSGCPTSAPPAVTVGSTPLAVEVDQATGTVFVTQAGGVAVFAAGTCDATTQSACGNLGTLSLGNGDGPYAVAVDQAHRTLYTANGDNTISAFDLRDCHAGDLAGCASVQPGTMTVPGPPGFDESISIAVDAATHTVYVPFYHDDAVIAFDADQCNGGDPGGCGSAVTREIHTGTEPESIVLDPTTQTLYTANEVDDDLSVIAAARCNAVTSAGCRPLPPQVAFPQGGVPVDDAADSTVYIPSVSGTIGMLDTATCNAATSGDCPSAPITFTGGDTPQVAALNPSSHTVYIANAGDGSDGSVSVIDTRTCNAQTQVGCSSAPMLHVPAGAAPVYVDVDTATDTVYVAADSSGGIGTPAFLYVFDGATCDAIVQSGCGQAPVAVPLGTDGPSSVAVDQATNTIYVALVAPFESVAPGEVAVIDGATCNAGTSAGCGAPLATPAVGVDPQSIAVDQSTDTIYTADQEDTDYQGTVSILDGGTCNAGDMSGCDQTAATATVGFGPLGIAVDQPRDQIWVQNTQDTSVSVIDGRLCNGRDESTCVQTWPERSVTDYPVAAAFADATQTAYVVGWTGISIVSTTPGPWSTNLDGPRSVNSRPAAFRSARAASRRSDRRARDTG